MAVLDIYVINYMRHRILDVINLSLKNDTVEGIVEVD